ncbi:transcription-repair coupling factor [Anaeromicropila populeti]|uniref:Transcription-repair-coupling factor n=1 Tax=Anaeromicropila populeti TaxID=37658 RepID=A0A1I6IZ96_9FIRM|nr:transcription-repair coupling factor [Anaeromicropila populeti]SFR71570.1 transcription-repair coupling factor [Anaeromicropila populeti]
MKTFFEPLKELKEFQESKKLLKNGVSPVHITGAIDTQKVHFMSGLAEEYCFKVIITYSELKAKEIYEDYRLFDKDVFLYPSKDIIFYSADIHGNAIVRDRIRVLKRLLEKKPATVIMTVDGGMDRLLPLKYIENQVFTLKSEQVIDLDIIKEKLVHLGYERAAQVEGPGQFAVRGGIIDIFPLTEDCPYRVELWDDEIDTIRSFDVESQRSIEQIDSITIYPATEVVLDKDRFAAGIHKIGVDKKKYVEQLKQNKRFEEAGRISEIVEEFKEKIQIYSGSMGLESYISYFYEETVSFFSYLQMENSIFFVDEPNRCKERGEAVELEFRESMLSRIEKGYILPQQMDAVYPIREVFAKLLKQKLVLISTMDYTDKEFSAHTSANITVKSMNSYQNNFEVLIKDLERWKHQGYRVVLLSSSRTRAKRLSADICEYNLNAFYSETLDREVQKGEIMVAYGVLHRGYEYPLIKFVVITESDIFGAEKKKKKKKKSYEGTKVNSFTDLNIGDYVVHENHGVGIYRGIEKIEVDKITKDYIKIEYANSGTLYVLATGLDVIQKYADSNAKKPKLNKLNSIEWKNTKAKVRGAVKEIAKDLVELYAKRQSKKGHEFSKDTVWQTEFEEMFPYEETEDQLTAIEETKKDMESSKIMDRLICGDVGYGKTEVAIRAAFKAVLDGRQVVFLVPTTILAQQHYNTFTQRMKDFPVTIDMLSRFRTTAQQKKAIQKLKEGSLDIIIGTHRVLSKDIAFRNLGLLIIDEEQRFGVTHKEKIKQIKEDVDVLTLSATPIPRTLHMSLVGIRDMSVLEEPPVDRLPIQTYVLEHNEEIIREAINRELARGGQVYYVYNHVNNIDEITNRIAALVPEANVSFAHGQMQERELEKIMFEFINGEIDVLVATTIIETGLDISNVNTMIIDDADRLGLSQLYQLRGRVGRSNRTAYAFLMYKRDKMLREIAEKRLQAIKEFTDLGSGFKIAMRDLEIRGAGNLLGAKQHGHMEAVGYDLYCKMLNDAVKALKGEAVEEAEFETSVDMDVDAYIPATYIKSEFQKLEIYKRVAEIGNEEEFLDMQEELLDRFGDIPSSVNHLLQVAFIKALAHKAFIIQVKQQEKSIKMVMYGKAMVDVTKIPDLIKEYNHAMEFTKDTNPFFTLRLDKIFGKGKIEQDKVFECIKKAVSKIYELLQKK